MSSLVKAVFGDPKAKTAQVIDEMKELHIARLALVKDRTAAKNREHACRSPLLKRHAAQRLAQIDRQIKTIDSALQAFLESDADLMGRFRIIASIPGIGTLTAVTMLIAMPELGSLDNKQVASLAGLAPQARDSGQHRGKRHIRGGRAILRQALYMPALVATRYNADMKAKYQAMTAAGKPAKVAITTIMRKLIILANALLRANRPWTQKMA
jgi:transposase